MTDSKISRSQPNLAVAKRAQKVAGDPLQSQTKAILVLDYRTLTCDMDPVAALTEFAVEMWEDLLLTHPEAAGPAN